MDFNHNEYDTIYNQVCGHIEWFNIDSQSVQRQEVRTSIKDGSSLDYFQSISEIQSIQYQQINANSQSGSNFNEQIENQNSSMGQTQKDSKTKYITKTHQKSILSQKEKVKRSSKINSKKDRIQTTKKSKFNNMGGFLIGTFSDILNIRKKYRFVDGIYQIFIHSKWISIGHINSFDALMIEKEMASLKFKLSMLPRKQGAKKHLFEILNEEIFDSHEIKMSKSLLRKQIIYSLSQRNWLLHHVSQRDFKPQNDDELGTKKRERHEAYLSYLVAVEFVLRTRNKLPKRVTL